MAAINFKSLSAEEANKFFDSFNTVLTDCDDVLWSDTMALPNSAEVINTFRNFGKRVFYVTNNSIRTRKEFAMKCIKYNFKATEEEILCTSQLAAHYLKSINFTKKAYVIGKAGIAKELENVGISSFGVGPDPIDDLTTFTFPQDPDVGAVIVGFDEHFSYAKIARAATYLVNPNVHFIVTNTDLRSPKPNNIVYPCTGSLLKAIEAASKREAFVIGKPGTYLSNVLKNEFNLVDSKQALMIGDRGDTDILLGTKCGFKTLLVLSGDTKLKDVEELKKSSNKEEQGQVPDYYIDTLGDLLPYLQNYKLTKSG